MRTVISIGPSFWMPRNRRTMAGLSPTSWSNIHAIHGRPNLSHAGHIRSLDVPPGDDGNDESNQACGDAPEWRESSGGLGLEPGPQLHVDIGGSHEKDHAFQDH